MHALLLPATQLIAHGSSKWYLVARTLTLAPAFDGGDDVVLGFSDPEEWLRVMIGSSVEGVFNGGLEDDDRSEDPRFQVPPGELDQEEGNKVKLSVVVPMYNEQDVLEAFFSRLIPVVEKNAQYFEIICVNDGSSDATLEKLCAIAVNDPRIRVIDFSRNFGKEAALSAGLAHARGDAAVLIDADLQDPPELINQFVALWEEGYDAVCGVREDRQNDTRTKRISAKSFYEVYNLLSPFKIIVNAGDFRLLSRKVIDAINTLPERRRFMKGIYGWVGFKQGEVHYVRQPRLSGSSKWNYWRLWNFALDGLSSFTTVPLRLWTYIGMGVLLISILLTLMFLGAYFLSAKNPPGFYWIVILILFFGSVQMVSMGIIGEYVGRILEETKQRPLYIIKQKIGFDPQKVHGVIASSATTSGSSYSRGIQN